MMSLISNIHIWSLCEDINIPDNDYGTFKYIFFLSLNWLPLNFTFYRYCNKMDQATKRLYCERRGLQWNVRNKGPEKLKDKFKELEEYLSQNRVVCSNWQSANKLQLLLSKGLLVTIMTNECSDIINILFDKSLVAKIQTDTICDGNLKVHKGVGFSSFFIISNILCQVMMHITS